MDKRKDTISTLKICRFCLTQDVPMTSLYDKKRKIKNTVNLALKILACVSVEVFPSDKMPTYICERCKYFMNLFYDFKNICRQADEAILHYVQDNKPFKPIGWPVLLNDAYRESNDIGVVKTVVEGGTTVQVTHDMSDSEEEEEENVYNVKISDGSDEVSKTCVKVVASRDNEEKRENKGFPSVTKLSRHVRIHAGERPYPCKYCDKSFMKSHHYTRHVRVKHRDEERARAGNRDSYRCDQCEVSFNNQDELIYHSAIHATQNLTCPLCQEKFANVDDVTAHIKSHVNGMEFMCDFCELVFTTKEKLDNHMMVTHEDEIQNELGQDESSMEADDIDPEAEADDEDDNSINVKEEDDHMVIEIKKADEFLLKDRKTEAEEKLGDNSNSEDSDAERMNMEQQATIGKIATMKKIVPAKISTLETLKPVAAFNKPIPVKIVGDEKIIIRKSEEIKRSTIQETLGVCDSPIEKKVKQLQTLTQVTKIETGNDKSLRLLEKELQDLKRTNSRSEAVKTPPVKTLETPRGRGRQPLHASTPKIKPTEDKKTLLITKTPIVEKKLVEKKVITKENKEPKNVVKNGTNDKSGSEDGIRRSTRPCKIKDYAKMLRVNTQENSDSDELDDDDDEYRQGDKSKDGRIRGRRNSVRPNKGSPAPSAPPPTTPVTPADPTAISTPTIPTASVNPATMPPRKRGRPKKEQPKEIPQKIKKSDPEPELETVSEAVEEKPPLEPTQPSLVTNQSNADAKQDDDSQDSIATEPEPVIENKVNEEIKQVELNNLNSTERKSPNVEPEAPQSPSKLISPTGQTLKKIPIRSLPPGVKPLPLPIVGRSLQSGELCQMQIGKKVVKVQKIVMTKAEVEAMAKQGLVEMKDGTMVLKQGVKIPKVESVAVKSVAPEGDKDSPNKRDRAIPTRCSFGEE